VTTLLVSSAVVQAAPYQFEFLAERPRSTSDSISFVYKLPALNDHGTVAMLLQRADANNLRETIYTGTPGDLRQVDTGGLTVGAVSINNSGRIGFLGGVPPVGRTVNIYAVSSGGPVVKISDPVTMVDRLETAIADNGTVMTVTDYYMFAASTVVMGDGTAPAREVFRTHNPGPDGLYHTTLMRPRMSVSGDWVATERGGARGFAYSAIHTNYGSIYAGTQPPGISWESLGTADVTRNGVVLFQDTFRSDPSRLYTSTAGGQAVRCPGRRDSAKASWR
jgi:hypothetical protein